MMRLIIQIVLLLYVLTFNAKAQTLKSEEILNAINDAFQENKFNSYDSLILYNTSGYWKDGIYFNGIGFMNNKMFKVTMKCKKVDVKLKIPKISRKLICFTNAQKKMFDFSDLKVLNNDSINLIIDPKTKTAETFSDGLTYTMIYVTPRLNKVTIKQSYMPEYYQKKLYTKDRAKFIEILDYLESF
jgi:hypothetical protein